MYKIYDKSAAIRNVKEYLYIVSERIYPQISRTTIDGIYDEDTKKAVAEFQKIKGIEPSGEVSYETFTLLYNDYKSVMDDFYTFDYIIESGGFPLKSGSSSEDVRLLHILINELSKTYSKIENVGTGSYYSHKTAKSVRLLRKLFAMEDGDYVDKPLYLRIKKEIKSRRNADQNSFNC